jgi:LDH2 family malate/lactate/ureidoglycolate dehydrogenase
MAISPCLTIARTSSWRSDVAHFGDAAQFRERAAAAAEHVRSGRRAPGVDQLFTPGEPEWRRRQRAAGHVRLEPAVAAMLTRFAGELGVAAPFHEPVR